MVLSCKIDLNLPLKALLTQSEPVYTATIPNMVDFDEYPRPARPAASIEDDRGRFRCAATEKTDELSRAARSPIEAGVFWTKWVIRVCDRGKLTFLDLSILHAWYARTRSTKLDILTYPCSVVSSVFLLDTGAVHYHPMHTPNGRGSQGSRSGDPTQTHAHAHVRAHDRCSMLVL